MDKLKGEFCYIQTKNGRIVSIHYTPTEDEEGTNVKRGIAGAFQANFDYKKEVKELDPGSSHISHYRYVDTYQCTCIIMILVIQLKLQNFLVTVLQRHPVE